MKLIADSGSTKTSWCLLREGKLFRKLNETIGLNPHYNDNEAMIKEISEALHPQILKELKDIREIHFYGAGCSTPVDVAVVRGAIETSFPNATVAVEHDLLGAARALCQRAPGLVAILGTGSNSCYYDGKVVADNIDALGFMLGDEGGGGNLGRMLIRSFFYREMPKELRELFYEKYQLTKQELFTNVYHRPLPNRYIAKFSKFAGENRDHSFMKILIAQNFRGFIECSLMKYEHCLDLPIHFIGSIGIAFEKELRNALNAFGMKGGDLVKSPMDGLITFHCDS